ncbi:MAG: FHA domain-containing protein [Cyanophyceae cyanobacterium]
MITLILLHPLKAIPVQHWSFNPDAVIRVGRSANNHVVLYSAVVSRQHLEIKYNGSAWEIASMGANGTFVNGERITQMTAVDGMIIRLASSGPQIKILIDLEKNKEHSTLTEKPSPRTLNRKLLKKTLVSDRTVIGTPKL